MREVSERFIQQNIFLEKLFIIFKVLLGRCYLVVSKLKSLKDEQKNDLFVILENYEENLVTALHNLTFLWMDSVFDSQILSRESPRSDDQSSTSGGLCTPGMSDQLVLSRLTSGWI